VNNRHNPQVQLLVRVVKNNHQSRMCYTHEADDATMHRCSYLGVTWVSATVPVAFLSEALDRGAGPSSHTCSG
jgi:hypothetical protein